MNETNPLAKALNTIATDLGEIEVSFAIVGGIAVSVRSEPRFTRDADVAVSKERRKSNEP